MEKNVSILGYIGIIYLAALLAGLLTFTAAGGIPGLARDAGVSGAWLVLILYQLIYGTLLMLAFLIFVYVAKENKKIKPAKCPSAISAIVLSVLTNIFGIYGKVSGIDFLLFCLVVIALAFMLFIIVTQIYNGLTNRSKEDAA